MADVTCRWVAADLTTGLRLRGPPTHAVAELPMSDGEPQPGVTIKFWLWITTEVVHSHSNSLARRVVIEPTMPACITDKTSR